MSEADHPKPKRADASLWTFAVDLHAAPGVAEACLALQDRHGCDVNIILFAAWIGAVHRRAITPAETAEAAAAVRHWQAEIVRPLRSVRRRLKTGPAPAPSATSEALRARLKPVEIEAERIELAMLETLVAKRHRGGSNPGEASLQNLIAAVRHYSGGEMPAEALELIHAIEKRLRLQMAASA
jgi:uncharacterized protein (TIGR02444 family)